MNAPHFVRKTKLDDLSQVRAGGRPAVEDYDALHQVLHERCGPDVANLFAEPVMTRGNGAAPSSVSWYAPVAGEPVPLAALDAEARAAPEEDLRRRLVALQPLLDDPEHGPLLRSALYVASPDDLLVLNNQVVLTNWGLVPPGTLEDGRARQRHFDGTLGRYATFAAPALDEPRPVRRPPGTGGVAPGAAAAAVGAGAGLAGAAAQAATPPLPGSAAAGSAGGTGGAAGGAAGGGGDTGGTGGGPAAAPPAEPPGGPGTVVIERGRPWVPVLVAVVIAALVLAFLLIPGVLRYPERPTAAAGPDLAALVELQREINRSLEEQIRRTEAALNQGVCHAEDSTLQYPGLPGAPGRPGGSEQPGPGGTVTPGAPGGPGGQGNAGPQGSAAPPNAPGQPGGPQTATPASLLPPAPEATIVPPTARPNQQPFEGTLVDLLDKSTALVVAQTRTPGQLGIGSGFFIAPEVLVTNFHVIENADQNSLYVTNRTLGRLQQASVIFSTRGSDIGTPDFAVLRVPAATNVVTLALTPTVGRLENVVAAGYPTIIMEGDLNFQALVRGDAGSIPEMALTQGVVTVVQNQNQRFPIIAHTASISPGNSGGPLVDSCGRVVGINTFGRVDQSQANRINYAIATVNLRSFLDSHGVNYAVVEGPCTPQTAAAAPSGAPPATPAAPGTAPPGGTAAPAAAPGSGDAAHPAATPGAAAPSASGGTTPPAAGGSGAAGGGAAPPDGAAQAPSAAPAPASPAAPPASR